MNFKVFKMEVLEWIVSRTENFIGHYGIRFKFGIFESYGWPMEVADYAIWMSQKFVLQMFL